MSDPRPGPPGARTSFAAGRRVAPRRTVALLAPLALCLACSGADKPRFLSGIRKVSPDVAFAMLRDAPDLLVVDVREPGEFEGRAGHLRSARNLPLSQISSYFGLLTPLRDTSFLVYCRGSDGCGEEAVTLLVGAGFQNAVVLDGGFRAWVAAGYPALTADPPESVDTTREALRATHRWEFAEGRLVEGGRAGAQGLYVAGKVRDDRFRPVASVEGMGDFCRGWELRSGEQGRRGWLELGRGVFLGQDDGRLPSRPFVVGCVGADGKFRPESRDVTN